MIDAGDLFMVEWVPGEWNKELDGHYLVMVIEPDYRGSASWICEMCHTGKRYLYSISDIEQGKILLAKQTN